MTPYIRKFKVGDRVIDLCWHKGQKATIKHISNPFIRGIIYILIQYDNKDLGWELTQLDHERGVFKNVKNGKGYYQVLSTEIKLISRSVCTMREANHAAIKEQVEQEEVIRLTNEFIQKLKEAWQ